MWVDSRCDDGHLHFCLHFCRRCCAGNALLRAAKDTHTNQITTITTTREADTGSPHERLIVAARPALKTVKSQALCSPTCIQDYDSRHNTHSPPRLNQINDPRVRRLLLTITPDEPDE